MTGATVKRAGGCPECGGVVGHEDTFGVCPSCGWAYSLTDPAFPVKQAGDTPLGSPARLGPTKPNGSQGEPE